VILSSQISLKKMPFHAKVQVRLLMAPSLGLQGAKNFPKPLQAAKKTLRKVWFENKVLPKPRDLFCPRNPNRPIGHPEHHSLPFLSVNRPRGHVMQLAAPVDA